MLAGKVVAAGGKAELGTAEAAADRRRPGADKRPEAGQGKLVAVLRGKLVAVLRGKLVAVLGGKPAGQDREPSLAEGKELEEK